MSLLGQFSFSQILSKPKGEMTVGACESRQLFLPFEIIPSRNGGVEAIEIVDFRVLCAPKGEIAKRSETSRNYLAKL